MSKKFLLSLIALVSSAIVFLLTNIVNGKGNTVSQSSSPCLSQFYSDVAPEIINKRLASQTYPLCFTGHSLVYSGISRTPLWSAEKLTPTRLSQNIKRENNFHEETRLPESARATLADYRGSGYDRGHMAPNGDMPDVNSQYDSFSLANMVPQTPRNNEVTWRGVEDATRAMVKRYKLDAYVVTGPAFLNAKVQFAKQGSKVFVPSHIFKAVYFPQINMATAYFVANTANGKVQNISICELEEKTGMNIFPQMSESTKRQVFDLPLNSKDVRANKQPSLLRADRTSHCASAISAAQISATQNAFTSGTGSSSTATAAGSVISNVVNGTSQQADTSKTTQQNTNYGILYDLIELIKKLE